MSLFILIFAGTMAISVLAALRVKSAYAKYSLHPATSGYTGAEAAEQILQAAGVYDVQVVELDELLGDHYDPLNKRFVLSSGNFHSKSTAALGIAAHECGHAIQHNVGYAPLQWRMAAVGLTNFASQAVLWLPLGGYVHRHPVGPHWADDNGHRVGYHHALQPCHSTRRIRRQPSRQGSSARNGVHPRRRGIYCCE
jgi:Zn-dependent membrane protease YugP